MANNIKFGAYLTEFDSGGTDVQVQTKFNRDTSSASGAYVKKTVAISSTQAAIGNYTGGYVILKNIGATTLYIGPTGVTTGGSGAVMSLFAGDIVLFRPTYALYAIIATAGTSTLDILVIDA